MRRWMPAILLVLAIGPGASEAWGFPGSGEGPSGGVLLVEITQAEGVLQVAQAWFPGPGKGARAFPLLVPEAGQTPAIRPAAGGDSEGIQARGRGGARAEYRDGALYVSGEPDGSGDFVLEVTYRIPVTTSRLVLRTPVTEPLVRVQVIHPGGTHALHVRPLHPYLFREEDEGDGAWRYQDLLGPLASGQVLRIAVGRLPEARRPYRWAGVLVIGAVGLLALFELLRRRD